ncbi:MAG: hypothetical protein J0G37_10920 [Afipia sp.]|jgi:hypothetical protein|nr:hypothetical protein [Afipia sp.]
MTGPDVKVPRNVFGFEVLLYLSLLIDSLSAAFIDRAPEGMTGQEALAVNFIAVVMILALVQLVWLAAHRRQNWARMILVAALVLSVLSIVASVGQIGLGFSTVVDVVSTALTAWGLWLSFTGDARDWFQAP